MTKSLQPHYNILLKDDKHFPYVRLDERQDFPRFEVVRRARNDGARYFGPYLSAVTLRDALSCIRDMFPVRHCKKDIAKAIARRERPCLMYHLNKCCAPCSGNVTREEYHKLLDSVVSFLEGDTAPVCNMLRAQMQKASDNMEYEKAAKFRDLISAIRETQKANARGNVNADISRSSPAIAIQAMDSLQKTLKLKKLPRAIECFDISHISGSFCVASMVRFEDGEPAKQKYRRFKIKSFIGNDDFRAMKEVVGRRYSRLDREGIPMPDIVLIDGGKGQVFSAMKAFDEAGIKQPFIAGLAKREETIVLDDFTEKLLPRRHEGLRLLQRVRDEAHRFANSFSEALHIKKIRESILDDFPGLGEKRKNSLLKHFGSIAKIKSASVEQLRQVDGIGLETAAALREFLDANFPPENNA